MKIETGKYYVLDNPYCGDLQPETGSETLEEAAVAAQQVALNRPHLNRVYVVKMETIFSIKREMPELESMAMYDIEQDRVGFFSTEVEDV